MCFLVEITVLFGGLSVCSVPFVRQFAFLFLLSYCLVNNVQWIDRQLGNKEMHVSILLPRLNDPASQWSMIRESRGSDSSNKYGNTSREYALYSKSGDKQTLRQNNINQSRAYTWKDLKEEEEELHWKRGGGVGVDHWSVFQRPIKRHP